MYFLTNQFAGDRWLESRLTLFAKASGEQIFRIVHDFPSPRRTPSEAGKLASESNATPCVAAESAAPAKVVHLIRNPLAMLVSFGQCDSVWNESNDTPATNKVGVRSAALTPATSPGSRETAISARWRKASSSATRQQFHTLLTRMAANAGLASIPASGLDVLNVRIEDFAAFPAVTLRTVCEFFSVSCSVGMVRAFLDADRLPRRQPWPVFGGVQANIGGQALTSRPVRGESMQAKRAEHLDLFSWVDDIPAPLAAEVVAHHEQFFAAFYPEILRVCVGGELRRRVG